MLVQLLLNACIAASLYTVAGVGFAISFRICRFFNFTYGFLCTLGAYGVFAFTSCLGIPIGVSIAAAVLATALLGLLIDTLVFRKLRNDNRSPLVLMLASIGVYVVGQNLISICFGDELHSLQPSHVNLGLQVFGGRLTTAQIVIIIASTVVVLSLAGWLAWTKTGRAIRATASNRELAAILGINTERVTAAVIIVSSAMAAIAGLLYALDRAIVPTMGMNVLLFSIVVMIVGGQGSLGGLAAASALVALAQSLTIRWAGAEWENTVAFVALILFLLFRPQGIFGQTLRKSSI